MKAVFSQKEYIQTSGKKAKRRRIISLASLLFFLISFSKLDKVSDMFPIERSISKSVVFLIMLFVVWVLFVLVLIIKLKRNSAKESTIEFDGEKIVYDCLHYRRYTRAYSEQRRYYTIYECSKITENSDKYVFYGNISYIKKDNFGNVSTHQCKRVFIPKYFDNLDEIVKQFKQNKNL